MATEYTTIKAILFKSKTLSNGEHPIMLRVTKNRVRKYISLGISCHSKDWNEKDNLPKKSHPHKSIIDKIISKKVAEYNDALMNLKSEDKDFTPDVLINKASKPISKITVFNFFEQKIQQLKDAKQIGNSKVYNDTRNKLKKFLDNKDITFSQIDYNFLLKFETSLKADGLSDTGISVRMRTLRALFNAAIEENYAKRDNYPFHKFKITERYNTKTQKRAITKEELKKIEALVFKQGSSEFEAQQYFLFSYYGQGINFVDVAHLKWVNLIDGRIYYKRAKTGTELNFKLPAPALKIIEFWRISNNPPKDDYIFSILNKQTHITPTQQHNRIHKVLTRVNQDLKEIGKMAEIGIPLTSYVARHTFATVLKKSGVSTAIISESMGHQTEAITQTYLKSFENSIIDEAMENLL
ncbi:site-specific integrase [Pedobacter cryophilus]|uniref:Site-specific integrase n=1 Tax=Pedobacter cryophilus TaxID=2571271 RepID=A0A4U1C329_9SPHI|nr:site-specific integrase [Pedobacter cryophilus]TKC00180.1 site-specific integrase [Pedobacter cryophilus]